MDIGIIGGGSIGLLVGSYLASNHRVTMYVRRSSQCTELNTQGLTLADGPRHRPVTARLLEDLQAEDLLVVCVKQTQLAPVLAQIKAGLSETPLIFLQNGLGHHDKLEHLANPIMLGVVDHGAQRVADNEVRHTGQGQIQLAAFNLTEQRLRHYVNQLHTEAFPVVQAGDWKDVLYDKLMINAVINPLTAIFNVRNGLILTHPHLKVLARELCCEVAQALARNETSEWERIKRMIEQTSENKSSMLTDLLQQQETEIEFILGYILKQSTEPLPYTTFAYNSVKALEVLSGASRLDG